MSSADPTFKGLLMLILHAAPQELGGRHQDEILDFCKHVLYSLPLGKATLPAPRRPQTGTCPALSKRHLPNVINGKKKVVICGTDNTVTRHANSTLVFHIISLKTQYVTEW